MDQKEARAYYNYLMTLNLRHEEAFGPLALTLINENDLRKLGLLPEEQFNLIMSALEALVHEPKRHGLRIEMMQKARKLLSQTTYSNPQLAQHLEREIKKTEAELEIYKNAMRPPPRPFIQKKQRLIVQSDAPEYFLDIAQKRAAAYYQNKFHVSKAAKTAQRFGGGPRKFDPDNMAIQKEFSGSCPPFMNSRINGFHLMLPFDLKFSRKFDDHLVGGRGLLMRTHAADKLPAYAETSKEAWMEGLSFNFVNIHLGLLPGHDTGFVPYNTPIFSVYPVLAQKNFTWTSIEDARKSNKP